jgi:hypothetical protein
MKTIIAIFALAFLFCACHKSSNTKQLPANKLIVASFPGIDTMTMWNVVSGKRTGGKALVSNSGEIQIIGYAGSRNNYASGTYFAAILDTSVVTWFISFALLDGSGDTVSKDNYLQVFQTTGWARGFYYLEIDGGKLPEYSIVSGVFVDSI